MSACYLCLCLPKKSAKSKTLHRFPKDAKVRAAWINACALDGNLDDVSKVKLCSLHFTADDYIDLNAKLAGGKLFLKKEAIPSRLLPNLQLKTFVPLTAKMRMPPRLSPQVPCAAMGHGSSAESTKRKLVDEDQSAKRHCPGIESQNHDMTIKEELDYEEGESSFNDTDYIEEDIPDIVTKDEFVVKEELPSVTQPGTEKTATIDSQEKDPLKQEDTIELSLRCTVCESNAGHYDIFETKSDDENTVSTMLELCTSVKASNVTPQFICFDCLDELRNYNSFRKRFVRSQQNLIIPAILNVTAKKLSDAPDETILEKVEASTSSCLPKNEPLPQAEFHKTAVQFLKKQLSSPDLCEYNLMQLSDDALSDSPVCQSNSKDMNDKLLLQPGIQDRAKKVNLPLDCFLHFMEPLLDQLLELTNKEMQSRHYTLVCREELLAMIGLLLYCGTLKKNNLDLKELFEGSSSKLLLNWTMSSARFKIILTSLRFDENESDPNDVFSPIRPMWSMFTAISKESHASMSSKNTVLVEERLFPFSINCRSTSMMLVGVWDTTTRYMVHGQLPDQNRPRISDTSPFDTRTAVYRPLCANFNCARRTEDWPLATFFAILNLASINSYVIYCINKFKFCSRGPPKKRIDFMNDLTIALIKPWLNKRSSNPDLTALNLEDVGKFWKSLDNIDLDYLKSKINDNIDLFV